MFKSLKEKLGKVVKKFSKDVEEEIQEENEQVLEDTKEEIQEENTQELNEESEEVSKPEEPKKSFISTIKEKVTTTQLSEDKFEELFFELEITLLENNMAQEVIDEIKKDLKDKLTKNRISRKDISSQIKDTVYQSVSNILDFSKIDLIKEIKKTSPYVICVLGVNGAGKTTTIAKLAYKLKKDFSIVIAAADTFRAAAIDQLEEHTKKLDVKLIKQNYGSDPAAVAFDAIKHAKAKNIDVVIIDTAGRLHSNKNLMQELKKIERVSKPNLKLFVGESITGNDSIEQAKTYNDLIGIDAIILSKVDIDEKGGSAISISKVTKKPIIYLGTGQNYEDLEEFDKDKIVDKIL